MKYVKPLCLGVVLFNIVTFVFYIFTGISIWVDVPDYEFGRGFLLFAWYAGATVLCAGYLFHEAVRGLNE